ncbi:NUDIX domain-containing protein [Clostridium chauvoei]|uniref:NUDIX hydrolase n=2 Tax=Clostridium chauvoei TaxID=46867 RepID=A0ABD4RE66_9CLOT|nr:NUDIX hydrolase [Clostridium chauvoei]ATD55173.1 ADP-ribose pyrophosphatase [Clostridium chauvoei]ATD57155.1 ADP-ribose pyrophosphatase [Clostridium chauvoei]MBX7279514.1 NUDIX hydrolase [Clostridium chauvoei]MBX7281883.1 NUDIX hydrolase [Clostridium chauvoei]MBX7284528.1 NUDIX hydrolase [Clostridium chauvoei]
MDLNEKTLKERVIHKGNFMTFINVDVELPNGNVGNRDILKHPGACAIIPFLDDEKVILVKQFRKPLEKVLLEIPAGKLDLNEEPKDCAIRELEEETGYKAKEIIYLGSIATAPGFCDEIIHLYKATGLIKGEKNCDEDEFTELVVMSLEEVKEKVKSGEIIDTKTVSVLAYL